MCYFQSVKFELYPEDTRTHLGYQELGETNQHWRKRAKQEKEMRDEVNQMRNKLKLIDISPAAERKAAERQQEYQA